LKTRQIVALFLAVACFSDRALAFCRTRTCQVDKTCEFDENGCSVGGHAAHWKSGCLSFAMQANGSMLQGISAEAASGVAEDAFRLWTDAQCHAGGTPPLTLSARRNVQCAVPEFNCNPEHYNANVIMFQDEGWVHGPSALAVTCVTLNLRTGEILDADMEINTTPPFFDFSLPGDSIGADLHTVITHEAGHFVGLDHSHLNGAVMFASYDDSVILSSLSDDDIAGVCEIYPGKADDPRCSSEPLPQDTSCVGKSACVPSRTPDEGCACTVPAPPANLGGLGWWPAVLLLLGARRRPRNRVNYLNSLDKT
jgi:MYXO-CTERM domain-containing protein